MKIRRCSIKGSVRARNSRVMADTGIAEEVSDFVFDADDVAELVADVTGEDVEVGVSEDGESVEFSVGDEMFICSGEPADESVESASKIGRRKKRVSASSNGRTVRRIPRRR